MGLNVVNLVGMGVTCDITIVVDGGFSCGVAKDKVLLIGVSEAGVIMVIVVQVVGVPLSRVLTVLGARMAGNRGLLKAVSIVVVMTAITGLGPGTESKGSRLGLDVGVAVADGVGTLFSIYSVHVYSVHI